MMQKITLENFLSQLETLKTPKEAYALLADEVRLKEIDHKTTAL
jgi:mannitol/fructose-specific phosphotransferase system IIA component (Ntr-type)